MSVLRLVAGGHELWLAAPDLGSALSGAELLSLSVAVVVDPDAGHTGEDHEQSDRQGEQHGMLHQEVRVDGVHAWNPYHAAPADVVAGSVVLTERSLSYYDENIA